MGSESLFFELVCYQPHQGKQVLLICGVQEEESELVSALDLQLNSLHIKKS